MAVEQWDRTFTTLDGYRGVNANMHTVEAYLAAADVTGDRIWLDRALRIVERVVHGWAAGNSWRIPEHFDADWEPDLEYNVDTPAHPFRPYGATIGHWLEWARLTLHARAAITARGDVAPAWMLEDAIALFDAAVREGWDVDGAPGFVYTVDWSGAPVVRERMHWVAAEGVAAAAALHAATGEAAVRRRLHAVVGVHRRAPPGPGRRVVVARARHRQPGVAHGLGRQGRPLPRGPGDADPAPPADPGDRPGPGRRPAGLAAAQRPHVRSPDARSADVRSHTRSVRTFGRRDARMCGRPRGVRGSGGPCRRPRPTPAGGARRRPGRTPRRACTTGRTHRSSTNGHACRRTPSMIATFCSSGRERSIVPRMLARLASSTDRSSSPRRPCCIPMTTRRPSSASIARFSASPPPPRTSSTTSTPCPSVASRSRSTRPGSRWSSATSAPSARTRARALRAAGRRQDAGAQGARELDRDGADPARAAADEQALPGRQPGGAQVRPHGRQRPRAARRRRRSTGRRAGAARARPGRRPARRTRRPRAARRPGRRPGGRRRPRPCPRATTVPETSRPGQAGAPAGGG